MNLAFSQCKHLEISTNNKIIHLSIYRGCVIQVIFNRLPMINNSLSTFKPVNSINATEVKSKIERESFERSYLIWGWGWGCRCPASKCSRIAHRFSDSIENRGGHFDVTHVLFIQIKWKVVYNDKTQYQIGWAWSEGVSSVKDIQGSFWKTLF